MEFVCQIAKVVEIKNETLYGWKFIYHFYLYSAAASSALF